MNEKTKALTKLLERLRLRKIIFIAGVLGVALLFLSNFVPFGKQTDTTAASGGDKALEERLCHAIESMEGVGKARVFLTLEEDAGSTGFGAQEKKPRVRGVLVLCEGGEQPVVAARVTEALTKALDISSAKICVEKLSNH